MGKKKKTAAKWITAAVLILLTAAAAAYFFSWETYSRSDGKNITVTVTGYSNTETEE